MENPEFLFSEPACYVKLSSEMGIVSGLSAILGTSANGKPREAAVPVMKSQKTQIFHKAIRTLQKEFGDVLIKLNQFVEEDKDRARLEDVLTKEYDWIEKLSPAAATSQTSEGARLSTNTF